jgi:transglutaminase-like putative cysteine protease
MKWGEVSAEDFRSEYAADPDASALILADYGTVHFITGGQVVYERHTRVLILTEQGYDWGTHEVVYNGERRNQIVSGIAGQSFTLRNGQVTRHRMDRKSIFSEDLDGSMRRVKFTLPALSAGTIVEYRYKVTSKSPIFLPNWTFQHGEPTLWSEFRAQIPDAFRYVSHVRGSRGYHIRTSDPVNTPMGPSTRFRYVVRDIPALRVEPFMTTPRDYRYSINFQLSQINVPGQGPIEFLSSWQKMGEELMGSDAFGRHLRATREVNDVVRTVTAGKDSQQEKMVALYDHVRKSIKFNDRMGYWADQSTSQVLRTRSGSSSEIALLLTNMLRAAGLSAHPVLISTRNNGQPVENYPMLRQFNDVLVHVIADGEEHLLDATDPHRPHNVLPVSALNHRGWLVDEKGGRWIPITSSTLGFESVSVIGTLSETGGLVARYERRFDGFSAVSIRGAAEQEPDREKFFRANVFDNIDGLIFTGYELDGLDGDGAAIAISDVEYAAFGQMAGDLLLFNPSYFQRLEENPFKLPTRTFPVDYAHPQVRTYEIRVRIPEGYELSEAPANRQAIHSSRGATYRRVVRMDGQEMVLQSSLQVTQPVFEPHHYAELRSLYDLVVAAEAEQIVLRRRQTLEEAR